MPPEYSLTISHTGGSHEESTFGAVLLIVVGASLSAADTRRNYSASECQGYLPSDASGIARANEGCYYNSPSDCSGSAITVILPITWQGTSIQFSDAKVNWGLPANQLMTCYISVMYLSGGVFYYFSDSQTVIPPGNQSFSYGKIDWNGTAGKRLPDNGAPIAEPLFGHAVCTLYAKDRRIDVSCADFGGYSTILGYQVTTVNP